MMPPGADTVSPPNDTAPVDAKRSGCEDVVETLPVRPAARGPNTVAGGGRRSPKAGGEVNQRRT